MALESWLGPTPMAPLESAPRHQPLLQLAPGTPAQSASSAHATSQTVVSCPPHCSASSARHSAPNAAPLQSAASTQAAVHTPQKQLSPGAQLVEQPPRKRSE